MKLANAALCANCDEVYDFTAGHHHCPKCAADGWLPISRIIQPLEIPETERIALRAARQQEADRGR